ncbi:MAG: hypothetical protein JW820_13285 [Spirochaetales bacterium]|nr:hypothetical protein [Spirochaetales bacterium]
MSRKNPIIELPVKIILTAEGVEWFIKHKRQLQRLRMADDSLEYGIPLPSVNAASLQKMINIDYIAAIELARTEFTGKRRQIFDLTKLIVYRILYKKFEHETFRVFLNSPLIQRWNRRYPSRIIDADSSFNHVYVENLLMSVAPQLPQVSQDIQNPVLDQVRQDPGLSEEEKQIQYFLSDHYMISIRNIMWCVLVKSRGQREYTTMIRHLQRLLAEFLARGRIADYLALLVNELLTYTETAHYLEIARKRYPGRTMRLQDLRDPDLRSEIRRHMQDSRDLLYMSYQVSGKGPSIGTENRLRIEVFNRTAEHLAIKGRIEDKIGGHRPGRALADFYREALTWDINPELGLNYLSYLQEECVRVGVSLDSKVTQIVGKDLTVVNLTLQF